MTPTEMREKLEIEVLVDRLHDLISNLDLAGAFCTDEVQIGRPEAFDTLEYITLDLLPATNATCVERFRWDLFKEFYLDEYRTLSEHLLESLEDALENADRLADNDAAPLRESCYGHVKAHVAAIEERLRDLTTEDRQDQGCELGFPEDMSDARKFMDKFGERLSVATTAVVHYLGGIREVDKRAHDLCQQLEAASSSLSFMAKYGKWSYRQFSEKAMEFIRAYRALLGCPDAHFLEQMPVTLAGNHYHLPLYVLVMRCVAEDFPTKDETNGQSGEKSYQQAKSRKQRKGKGK